MTNSLDFSQWKWTHQPQYFDVSNKKVSITTEANTDLWQRTYYHFQNDNAPIFQIADYGLVGDLFQVIPLLLQELSSF